MNPLRNIRKLLVANRGEIARRIFRTCRDMGIATVAVYSDADAGLPFVREADEAVRIGPAPSRESYLDIARVLEAARRTGADAIHPGYGFLSERAEFAEACVAAGITFVGPRADAIRAMGRKREAKRTAAAAGVPVIPGFDGGTTERAYVEAARNLGYPVLLKASAGGGGKGMRIVRGDAELPAALEGARREALAAFGDDAMIVEKYIEEPRHVEVQILGDLHGRVVHLFERECSVQRRYQKIVEESPSPAVGPELRARMGDAAVRLAEVLGYSSAGTVEFILAPDGHFYFLEVNTRLQVEHPVTELVTGVDLVREQLRVAEGHPLPFTQSDLVLRGAAIEVRVYAEDPAKGMLPESGPVLDWHLPPSEGVRVDGGVETGDEVSIHYDPLLAKVIAHGGTREEARRRLVRALERLSVAGLGHNRGLLLAVLEHPDFVAGRLDTHFLETRFPGGLAFPATDAEVGDAAVAAALSAHAARASRMPVPSVRAAFRNNRFAPERTAFVAEGRRVEVAYTPLGGGALTVEVALGDGRTTRRAQVHRAADDGVDFELDGLRRRARVVRGDRSLTVHLGRALIVLTEEPRFPPPVRAAVAGAALAPMPAKVVKLAVTPGDAVRAGDVLVVLEAMKMEHTLTAAEDGVVTEVRVALGDQVAAGTLLAVVCPNASEP